MTRRSEQLSEALHDYAAAHSTPPDQILLDLAEETARRFGSSAGYADRGRAGPVHDLARPGDRGADGGRGRDVHRVLVHLRSTGSGFRRQAAVLRRQRRVHVGRAGVLAAGRAGRPDRAATRPAAQTLAALPAGTSFDFAFIDADKEGYVEYWDLIVPMIRQGGVILVDNTLSHGRVVDPAEQGGTVQGIREFNDHALADSRVELVLLPIGDGVTMARKL